MPTDARFAAEVAEALADRPEPPWYDLGRPIPASPNRVPTGLSFKATALLRLCSFLGPDSVPLELFADHPELLPMELRGTVDAAAKELGFRGTSVTVNRGVALGVRAASTDEEAGRALVTVRKLLRAHLPEDVQGTEGRTRWRAFLKHALAAVSDPGVGPAELVSWLHDRAATYLQELDRLPAARLLFERALRLNESAHGPDHPDVGLILANLGIVLRLQGDHDAAAVVLERAVSVTGKAFGRDTVGVMYPVGQLGLVMSETGRHSDARFLLEWALNNARKNFGPDHPETASRLAILADTHHDLGDDRGARAMYAEVLRIEEAAYGPESPEVGERLYRLGLLLKQTGDRHAAVNALERALPVIEGAGPSRRNDVIVILGALGVLHIDDREPRKAIDRLEKALPLAAAAFGSSDPQVGLILHGLAVAKYQIHFQSEAKRLLARAIAIFEAKLGAGHEQTKASRAVLATWP